MKLKMIIFLLVIVDFSIFSTNQEYDLITLENRTGFLETNLNVQTPLEDYYYNKNIPYPFVSNSSANHRGHIAEWEIVDKKLYLIKISINGQDFDKSTIFPGAEESVPLFADFFTGYLLVKYDQFLRPYDDISIIDFKEYEIIKVENGVVCKEYIFSYKEYWKIKYKYENDMILPENIEMIFDELYRFTKPDLYSEIFTDESLSLDLSSE
ncbi:hypothetical protein [Spirochaeta cellobiosiphila]|uniref:hypothetical protein n=1 Tax=Spirochaeta cellobiosiphila TaxID=504483 RepID=UPI0004058B4D|nr:hypothetical protein [Spirochaeta cellobiosiphila]